LHLAHAIIGRRRATRPREKIARSKPPPIACPLRPDRKKLLHVRGLRAYNSRLHHTHSNIHERSLIP
jgi:hypothetical protein